MPRRGKKRSVVVMNSKNVEIRENLRAIKPYVPGKPIDEVRRELGIEGEIIKMASNENPLGPSPKAIEAIRKAAANVFLYPDGAAFELRKALSRHMSVEPGQVICGNGSDELIELIGQAYFKEGDEVIYGDPTFSEYEFSARLMGATCVPVSLKNHTYDLEAMAGAITEKTKAVFICNPNNPTGTIVRAAEIDAFMSQVPSGVLIVFDEAYYEFVDDPDYISGMKYVGTDADVIVLRTFSKIHALAGLRVGYGIAKPQIIADLMRVREPFNINLIAQAAGVESLADEEHLKRSRELVISEKLWLIEKLEELGLKCIPTQANFVMADAGVDSVLLFKAMMKKGIIIRTGDIFNMPTYIRITFGTRPQNEKLISVLAEVLPAVKEGSR